MSKEDLVEMSGVVVEVLAGSWFKIKIDDMGDETKNMVLAYLGGKLRQNKIKVILGDKVVVAVSPYDYSRGKVVFRSK